VRPVFHSTRELSAVRETLNTLQVPFTYFPDPVGGTEIYVAGLVSALQSYGVHSTIAAPAKIEACYRHDDIPVFRLPTAHRATLAHAHGAPDEIAASSFREVIARLRPQIVHLHARTAAVSEGLVDIARAAGAKVIFTYHTPTVSCARGTMMWMGRSACDGRLDTRRCTACVLARHGVPFLLRDVLARTPQAIGEGFARARLAGGPFTALRLPALIGTGHRQFRTLMAKVDRVVAVSRWVVDVLRINGVPEEKVTLCRQGLGRQSASRPSTSPDPVHRVRGSALRLGYFGRLHPTKGVDILIEALRRAPDIGVHLEIYGVRQPGSEVYVAQLETAAAVDQRIKLRSPLAPDTVIDAMRRCDFVAVPSRWLETGPLVVLEAFAAGTPVLGARLGGIAELVADDTDGVLIDGGDPDAWAAAIGALANDRGRIERLRASVRAPRTMDDVAGEMASLYRSMLTNGKA
jgi:glycosyltransferase involved in cell wall biosynthesis